MAATKKSAAGSNGASGGPLSRPLLKRTDTELSIDQSGLQRLLPRRMRFLFADAQAESLYLDYYRHQKWLDFKAWMATALLCCLALATVATCQWFGRGSRRGPPSWLPPALLAFEALTLGALKLALTLWPRAPYAGAWAALPAVLVQLLQVACAALLDADATVSVCPCPRTRVPRYSVAAPRGPSRVVLDAARQDSFLLTGAILACKGGW